MTYKQAIFAGYRDADTKYQRGYISRKVEKNNQTVYTAGGNRRGEKYILLPCYHSTKYCVRQYLTI